MKSASKPAVHRRELRKLRDSGLVTVHPIGNQKHYQANPAAPIHAELVGIVRKTVGLAQPLRDALTPLADKITAAFVYGSVARRSDTADSDIDLMTGPGQPLAAEPPDAREFDGLMRSELARLKDARNNALSLESRFDLACSAV